MQLPELITPALLDELRARYQMDWNGIHGFRHWQRVCENGLRLAEENGADVEVVALFAFTHDIARQTDSFDLKHGPRAQRVIRALQGQFFELPQDRLELLLSAVKWHTYGRCNASITVQTCWDADRLDLGRVGIRPNPQQLCTAEARQPDVIEWAWQRSLEIG